MNQALMTQGFKGSPRLAGVHRYGQGWERHLPALILRQWGAQQKCTPQLFYLAAP